MLRIDPRPSMDFGVIVSAGGRDIANFVIKGHPARFPPHPDEDRPIAVTLPASVSSAGYDGITFVPASEGGRQQYRSIEIFTPQ